MNQSQQEAIAFFETRMPKRLAGRKTAINAIMRNPRPVAEAKRWVDFFKGIAPPARTHARPRGRLADLSDVQELIVSLYNDFGHVDVHVKKPVQQLAEAVVQGTINMNRFRRAAKVIVHYAKQGTTLPWENYPVTS